MKSNALYLCLIFVLSFGAFEIWCRFTEPPDHLSKAKVAYQAITTHKLMNLWIHDKPGYLQPPFTFFRNSGFEDKQRLKEISAMTAYPKNSVFEGVDFLSPDALRDQSRYKVTTNNLGFRGPDRIIEKPKNVKRIFMFGAYQTFGQGMNDDDTLPVLTERILNSSSNKTHYEIWNFGVPASTAIMGYATLTTLAKDYHPDLIICDYGIVDQSVDATDSIAFGDENLRRVHLTRKMQNPRDQFRLFADQVYWQIFRGHSRAADRLMSLFSDEIPYSQRIQEWSNAMIAFKKSATALNVPIIMTDQAVTGGNGYQIVSQKAQVPYWSLRNEMLAAPATEKEWQEFMTKPNWTQELTEESRGILKEDESFAKLGPFFGSFFQLNQTGYKKLAPILAKHIRETLQ